MRCAAECGRILAKDLGLSPIEGQRQARLFLIKHAGSRVVAMGPLQARQEALVLAELRATLGASDPE
jgi:glycerol-3-phosphate dehydrogenase